jgi:hypothetical protein
MSWTLKKKFKIHLKMPLKTPKTNTAELGFGALLLVLPGSCVLLHSSFCHLLLNPCGATKMAATTYNLFVINKSEGT